MLRYKAIRNAQNILCPEIMWWAYLVDESEEIQNIKSTWWESELAEAQRVLANIIPNQKQDE